MMSKDQQAVGEIRVRRIFLDSFGVLGAQLVPIMLASLILNGLQSILESFIPNTGTTGVTGAIIQAFLLTIVTLIAIAHFGGKQMSLRDAFKAVNAKGFGKPIPVALLAYFAIIAGLIFLVVPGLVLMATLYVVVPASAAENLGVRDSFKRSWELTKGDRWRIGAIAVLLPVGIIAILFGTLLAAGPLLGDGETTTGVFLTLVATPLTAFQACVIAVTYHALRSVKEGWSSQEIAAGFH